MTRKIVISSNCQTGGLYSSLTGMLPDDEVSAVLWGTGEPAALRGLLAEADVWVSSQPIDEARSLLVSVNSNAQLIEVPTIWFPAFHPDLTHVPVAGVEMHSAAGPYHSAIVVWGWKHGLSAEQILRSFSSETFASLGYYKRWDVEVAQLRSRVESVGMNFDEWFLPLVRGSAFMLTDNHPRVDAIIGLARNVAARLGAPAELLRYGWEQVLPDGLLSTAEVWPLYPGVAENLGLRGAFVWRRKDGKLLGLEEFVHDSLEAYTPWDPAEVDIPHIDGDARFAATLGRLLAEVH